MFLPQGACPLGKRKSLVRDDNTTEKCCTRWLPCCTSYWVVVCSRIQWLICSNRAVRLSIKYPHIQISTYPHIQSSVSHLFIAYVQAWLFVHGTFLVVFNSLTKPCSGEEANIVTCLPPSTFSLETVLINVEPTYIYIYICIYVRMCIWYTYIYVYI